MRSFLPVFLLGLFMMGNVAAEQADLFRAQVNLQPLTEELDLYSADIFIEKEKTNSEGMQPYLHPILRCMRGSFIELSEGSHETHYVYLKLSIPEDFEEQACIEILIIDEGCPVFLHVEALDVPLEVRN